MSMMPEAPERCRASPEIAWMETGVSNTLVAVSLLAVTVTSSSPKLSSAAAAVVAHMMPARKSQCSVSFFNHNN